MFDFYKLFALSLTAVEEQKVWNIFYNAESI